MLVLKQKNGLTRPDTKNILTDTLDGVFSHEEELRHNDEYIAKSIHMYFIKISVELALLVF
jgi:hypothetical protein